MRCFRPASGSAISDRPPDRAPPSSGGGAAGKNGTTLGGGSCGKWLGVSTEVSKSVGCEFSVAIGAINSVGATSDVGALRSISGGTMSADSGCGIGGRKKLGGGKGGRRGLRSKNG